jgi:hypothetical protein
MLAATTQNASAFTDASRAQATPLSTEMLVRLALVPVAVAICYFFRWEFLRFLTSEANLRLDPLVGIHLQRISADTVQWNGTLYRYQNACTFIDVWCGAIPLLWNLKRTLSQNSVFFACFAVVLFAFNVFRLSVSDVLFSAGLSWNIAHNVVSGIAYFAVWVWIWRHRPF